MEALHIIPKYAQIWLNNAWIKCAGCGRILNITCQSLITFFNMAPVLNMSRPEVGQGCEYAREIQDAEYAWINLNVPKECATMHEYALIMLNMLEPACIYLNKQKSEHTRILNASDVVHSLRSLYKLLSSYRDKAPYLVFRTLSNI